MTESGAYTTELSAILRSVSNRSAQAIIFFYSGLHYAPVSVRKAAWKLDRTFEAERTATFGSAVTHTGVVCFSPFYPAL